MIRLIRWAAVIAFSVLALLTAAIALIDRATLAQYLKQQVVAAAKDKGAILNWKNTKLEFAPPNIELTEFDILLPSKLIAIRAEDISFKLRLLDLLKLKLKIESQIRAYRGTIIGQVERGFSSSSLQIPSLIINNLDLASHPQIQGLGITRGTMSCNLSSNPVPDEFSFKASVIGVTKPLATKLPQQLVKSPIPIEIPAFSDLDISIEGLLAPNQITLHDIKVKSSLGSATGDAVFSNSEHLPSSRFELTRGSFVVNLSADGVKSLGGWISLASSGKLDPSVRSFRASFETVGGRLSTRLEH